MRQKDRLSSSVERCSCNKTLVRVEAYSGAQYYLNGEESLLEKNPIAVFCSREIPLSIYHIANETFKEMIEQPITIAGGWQSVMEKRVLKNYHKGCQANLIYFLAKGINNFRIPKHLDPLFKKGKLLIISPFLDKPDRANKKTVLKRDLLIMNLVERFFFLYIKKGGYLERIFQECLNNGKVTYLLKHQANRDYLIEGGLAISKDNVKELI